MNNYSDQKHSYVNYPSYELKSAMKKYTMYGFISAMSLIALASIITIWSHVDKEVIVAPLFDKTTTIFLPGPSSTEKVKSVAPQLVKKIVLGIERIGSMNLRPLPDIDISQDFANSDEIGSAMAHVGNQDIAAIDISKNIDLSSIALDLGNTVDVEELPDPEEFVFAEKYPEVDYSDLTKSLKYPKLARQLNMEGTVIIKVLVDKTGKPLKYNIVQSTHPIFNKESVNAVMNATYTPAIQNKTPIPCWVTIPIAFSLN